MTYQRKKPNIRVYFSKEPVTPEEERKAMVKLLSFLVSTAIEENLVNVGA